jgi:hypothetical protein
MRSTRAILARSAHNAREARANSFRCLGRLAAADPSMTFPLSGVKQKSGVTSAYDAAQRAALKRLGKHRPRLRLERPEIFPQPFDGLAIARRRQTAVLDLAVNV